MNTSVYGVQPSGFAQQLKSIFERLAREGRGVLVARRGTKLDLAREVA